MDAAASERASARKGRRRPAGRVLPHQPLQTLSRLVTGTSQCLPGAMVLKSLKAMLSISGETISGAISSSRRPPSPPRALGPAGAGGTSLPEPLGVQPGGFRSPAPGWSPGRLEVCWGPGQGARITKGAHLLPARLSGPACHGASPWAPRAPAPPPCLPHRTHTASRSVLGSQTLGSQHGGPSGTGLAPAEGWWLGQG